jgi:hypothetical protein
VIDKSSHIELTPYIYGCEYGVTAVDVVQYAALICNAYSAVSRCVDLLTFVLISNILLRSSTTTGPSTNPSPTHACSLPIYFGLCSTGTTSATTDCAIC